MPAEDERIYKRGKMLAPANHALAKVRVSEKAREPIAQVVFSGTGRATALVALSEGFNWRSAGPIMKPRFMALLEGRDI